MLFYWGAFHVLPRNGNYLERRWEQWGRWILVVNGRNEISLCIHVDIYRYMNSGNGYIIYSSPKKTSVETPGTPDTKCVVGTGFDKIVLTVAMNGWNRNSSKRLMADNWFILQIILFINNLGIKYAYPLYVSGNRFFQILLCFYFWFIDSEATPKHSRDKNNDDNCRTFDIKFHIRHKIASIHFLIKEYLT